MESLQRCSLFHAVGPATAKERFSELQSSGATAALLCSDGEVLPAADADRTSPAATVPGSLPAESNSTPAPPPSRDFDASGMTELSLVSDEVLDELAGSAASPSAGAGRAISRVYGMLEREGEA